MTSDDALSPVESLFLVQTLATYGHKAESFTRIADSLTEFAGLRKDLERIPDKFSEDSLRDTYLRLLKTEAKRHLTESLRHRSDDVNGTGTGTFASKEPLTLSPKTPTLEDALAYTELLPPLVHRLYDAYKEQAVREILEEEQRYDQLLQEIDQVKSQPTDIDQNENDSASKSVGIAFGNGILQRAVADEYSPPQSEQRSVVVKLTDIADSPEKRGEGPRDSMPIVGLAEEEMLARSKVAEASIRSILNTPVSEKAAPRSPGRGPGRSLISTSKDAVSFSQTQRRVPPPIAPAVPAQLSTPYPSQSGYRTSSDSVHRSPHESTSHRANIAPSPTSQYGLQNPYASSILPAPNVLPMQQTSSSHWAAHTPASGVSQPSGVLSAQPSLTEAVRFPFLPAVEPEGQQTEALVTQPDSAPLQPSGTIGDSQQQSILSNSLTRTGGIMLPPFQLTPQTTNLLTQAQSVRDTAGAVAQRVLPTPSGTPVGEGRDSRSFRQGADIRTPIAIGQLSPLVRTGPILHNRPGVSFSPGSSTGWKVAQSSNLVEVARPTWTPGFGDEVSHQALVTPAPNMTPKGRRAAKSTKLQQESHNSFRGTPSNLPSIVSKRDKDVQSANTTPSTTAISARVRTRCHSIVSQGEETAMQIPTGNVKHEPGTQADTEKSGVPDTKTPLPPRSRRQTKTTVAPSTVKRKRTASIDLTDPLEAETPRPIYLERTSTMEQPTTNPPTITAFRNFQRMTQPIMNNITSHKHASLFANPVKERDAEGYTDIIRRPQDLKSIRAAITAGSRAVAALTAGDGFGTPGTPRGGPSTPISAGTSGLGLSGTASSATVTFPWSHDLVPPRAIVNGAQLEQEVMRMFANAVMFNAGDDGVVRDTREMFESVEANIAAWRAAERNAAEQRSSSGLGGSDAPKAEDDEDELGDVDDGMAQPSAKRRRGI